MNTAECSVLSVRAGVDDSAADKFFLHLHENFTRDDGLMIVFHIILRNDTMIPYPCLREEVRGICFLQEGIANVFLISQNLVDVAGVPLLPACAI